MQITTINLKKRNKNTFNLFCKSFLFFVFIFTGLTDISAQTDSQTTSKKEKARVTGLRYVCVHVLELEKTLKLYQDILGLELADSEILKSPGLEGMFVLKLRANDFEIALTVTPPQNQHVLAPVGNTNHNHFMLHVNDIGPIGDRLKEEGYELENDNYVRDKYTFFTGPNGEIIGLSSWD